MRRQLRLKQASRTAGEHTGLSHLRRQHALSLLDDLFLSFPDSFMHTHKNHTLLCFMSDVKVYLCVIETYRKNLIDRILISTVDGYILSGALRVAF